MRPQAQIKKAIAASYKAAQKLDTIGMPVIVVEDDGRETNTTLASLPWSLGSGQWVAKLADRSSCFDCSRIRPAGAGAVSKAPAPRTAIDKLAEYLTGPEVGHHSVSLSMPPGGLLNLRERAHRFFQLREALGVTGYMNAAQACEAIAGQLHADEKEAVAS
jgi:hypothetical protein